MLLGQGLWITCEVAPTFNAEWRSITGSEVFPPSPIPFFRCLVPWHQVLVHLFTLVLFLETELQARALQGSAVRILTPWHIGFGLSRPRTNMAPWAVEIKDPVLHHQSSITFATGPCLPSVLSGPGCYVYDHFLPRP